MLKLYCLAVSPPLPARLAAMGVLLSVFHSSFTDGSRIAFCVDVKSAVRSTVLQESKDQQRQAGNTTLP